MSGPTLGAFALPVALVGIALAIAADLAMAIICAGLLAGSYLLHLLPRARDDDADRDGGA